eukprot:GFYU01002400.1.p1 GENE.GFYU01002400.1~~GFYU01002400.1.p1  ORF type:complete len:279 (+),score=65.86 GFYU01002400.1:97-837(+)
MGLDLPRKQPKTLTVQGPEDARWAVLGNSWRGQQEFNAIIDVIHDYDPARDVALVDVTDLPEGVEAGTLAEVFARFDALIPHQNGDWQVGADIISDALQMFVRGGGGLVLLNGSSSRLEFEAIDFVTSLETDFIKDKVQLGSVEVPRDAVDHLIAAGMAGKPLQKTKEIYGYTTVPERVVICDSESKLPLVFESPNSDAGCGAVVSVNAFCIPWFDEGFQNTYERDKSCIGELIYRCALYAATKCV